ncbi:MAG: helix-turn-helix domain-containing protein [Sarcina sp.]
MKLRDFKYFEYVCKTKSFTKAAEEMFTSQSVISSAIKEMELYFGVKLIERKKFSNILKITKSGNKVLDAIENINKYELELNKNLEKKSEHKDIKFGFSKLFEHKILEDYLKIGIEYIESFNENSFVEDEVGATCC